MEASLERAVDAYVAAWNEADPAERRRLLDEAVSDDCAFVGPTGTFTGRDALERLIAALRERLPGGSIVRLERDRDDAPASFRWQVLDADGATVMEGTDVVDAAKDGRLGRIEMRAELRS